MGVIGHVGRALDITFLTGVFILDVWLTQKDEDFLFSDVPERPISSLLCGFSAPIRLESDLTDSDLSFLLAHDSDEFNRYVP